MPRCRSLNVNSGIHTDRPPLGGCLTEPQTGGLHDNVSVTKIEPGMQCGLFVAGQRGENPG